MKNVFKASKSILVMLVLVATYSCSDDGENNIVKEIGVTEVDTVLEMGTITGLTDNILTNVFTANSLGQKSGSTNKTDDCYQIEQTDTGYTATFNNCNLNGTENINGTLNFTYAVDNSSLVYTATYIDFYVGEIKINGTKSFVTNYTLEDEGSYVITITSDISVVLEDGSNISETGTKTLTITQGVSLDTSTVAITGDWIITVDADVYSLKVQEELVSNFGCEYITAGILKIGKNGLSVNVDYGDGTCDAIATIIYPNGVEEEISLDD